MKRKLFAIQLEYRFTLEHEIHLLLTALAFLVLFNEGLLRPSRDEKVEAERVDPERMLQRIPRWIVRSAIGDSGDGRDFADGPACHLVEPMQLDQRSGSQFHTRETAPLGWVGSRNQLGQRRVRRVVVKVILVLVLLALVGLGGWFVIGAARGRRH